METIRIDDDTTVGRQPSVLDLFELSDGGFKSVVNLRQRGEKDQSLTPGAEAEVVKREGMEYRHIPVSPERLDEEVVDRFQRDLAEAPKPVFVHCRDGHRAAALVMMCQALKEGLSGEETIELTRAMGLACDDEILNDFVRTFVDERAGRKKPVR